MAKAGIRFILINLHTKFDIHGSQYLFLDRVFTFHLFNAGP